MHIFTDYELMICSCLNYSRKNWKNTQGRVVVPPVLFDACQQGLEPSDGTLTMSIQEGDDLTFGSSRPPQPGSDEPRTLLHPEDPHRHLQGPYVVFQLLLQELCDEATQRKSMSMCQKTKINNAKSFVMLISEPIIVLDKLLAIISSLINIKVQLLHAGFLIFSSSMTSNCYIIHCPSPLSTNQYVSHQEA